MLRPRSTLATTIGLAAVLAGPGALAQSPGNGWRLRVERAAGAEQCPGEAELASAVTARMGRRAFVAGASRAVELTLRRDGRRWSATLLASDEHGSPLSSRTIEAEGDECEPLSLALELSLALLLDPAGALLPAPAPAPARVRRDSASSSTLALPAMVPRPAPLHARGALWTGALLSVGLLARAAPGALLGGEVQYGALFVAELFALPSQLTTDGGLRLGSWGAGLLAGYDFALPAGFSVAVTAGLRVGALYGVGTAVTGELAQLEFGWLSAALRPRLRWAWRSLVVDFTAQGEVFLLRPAFVRTASDSGARVLVFQPLPAAFTPALALGVRFR